MITDVVIMAGGIGERLWPASTPMHPKQFFLLNDDLTFLQSSILRALALDISGKIIIVTRRELASECARQCNELCFKLKNESVQKKLMLDTVIIGEIMARHTVAALMTAVTYIKKADEINAHTILTISCDHVIENTVAFLADCDYASQAAEKGYLVTFGIKPSYVTPDFGYIQCDNPLEKNPDVRIVKKFTQKPDYKTAEKYCSQKDFLWNSGMLCFTADFFLRQAFKYAPSTYLKFSSILRMPLPEHKVIGGIRTVVSWPKLDEIYPRLKKLDVDNVISEKTKQAVVVKAHFSWADIGSWDSLSTKCELKQSEKVVTAEAQNNTVYTDIPVVLCGVEDLIVVQKQGKLLIMKKGSSSLLKNAVEVFNETAPDTDSLLSDAVSQMFMIKKEIKNFSDNSSKQEKAQE